MAATTRIIIKSWFRTHFKPTQQQFWNWMDSIWFKHDKIPLTVIEGLNEKLIQKVDVEALEVHSTNKSIHITPEERTLWNKSVSAFNLSYTPAFLNYTYFNNNVFGVFIATPTKQNGQYVFTHNLNVSKYLRLEVWENGLPFVNPKMKAREDLTQLVYNSSTSKIGSSPIGSTPIAGVLISNLMLTKNTIIIEGNYELPPNKLLYIEFTEKPNVGIGADLIGITKIK